jgi:hypothetical protein
LINITNYLVMSNKARLNHSTQYNNNCKDAKIKSILI